MPFTPFHFGPGLAVKAALRRHFSFSLFVLTQILIDLESGYFLFKNEWPVHRFLHTYVGASSVFIVALFLGKPICEFVLKHWNRLMNSDGEFGADKITWVAAITGSGIGAYSHVFLDSIMHADMQPFAPFTETNNLLHFISLGELHSFCIFSGVIGGIILFLPSIRGGKDRLK